MNPAKEPTVFPANQESNSGLLDVQKNADKQLWRVWDMAVHKPNCWKGFYELNPKYSPVTNFIHAIKILRRGETPLFTPRFPGNFMLKLVREEQVLRCEKCQSKLPFSFNYVWCNTLFSNWFYCFLLSGFKSVVCRFLGFLDSLGCLKEKQVCC